MKKKNIITTIIYFIVTCLIILGITWIFSRPQPTTTWVIHKIDGTNDTIEAKKCWIVSPDTIFIRFEIDDTTRVIYSRYGIESFQEIKN